MSNPSTNNTRLPNVLLIGTGEYTTGYVHGSTSTSDKPYGVIALTFFDLRARGLVGPNIVLCGRDSRKSSGLLRHLQEGIGARYQLDVTCRIYPLEHSVPHSQPKAYLDALNEFQEGDVAVITTPDHTHSEIALACIEHGLHVMMAKPVVQTLPDHWRLLQAVQHRNKPTVMVGEFHKRFDPMYSDALSRISSSSLGTLSFFHSYMSQPKSQLHTFEDWLIPSAASTNTRPITDISYYLNSHHIDFLNCAISHNSFPLFVSALAAKGVATHMFEADSNKHVEMEDTITINVQYAIMSPSQVEEFHKRAQAPSDSTPSSPPYTSLGVASFTSSWIAPPSSVHSQQRFFFLGSDGEINIDQAQRGYSFATEQSHGVKHANPLFMRYTPNQDGKFGGQAGYGYKSFEYFVEACRGLPSSAPSPLAHLSSLPSLFTTAILHAARQSLDQGNRLVKIKYDAQRRPIELE